MIGQRVENRQTGSEWLLRSCSRMSGDRLRGSTFVAVTAATFRRQQQGLGVHSWPLAELKEAGHLRRQENQGLAAATVFSSTPTPSISTVTTSPGCIPRVVPGVPVKMRSPGSKVTYRLM